MQPSEPQPMDFEAFDEFLVAFDETLAQNPRHALELVEAASLEVRQTGEWALCRAEALRAAESPAAAASYLGEVVREDPLFADAHHLLAEFCEELGDSKQAVLHQQETLRLDSGTDEIAEQVSADLEAAVVEEAGRAIEALPASVKSRMGHVPVLLAPRPTYQQVAQGLDARSLGVFVGPNYADDVLGEPAPTSITLFTKCLVDAFGEDERELLEQVWVTVLHEVGHYFCLDEQELAQLGLE